MFVQRLVIAEESSKNSLTNIEIDDVNWFCNYMNLDLFEYQKIMLRMYYNSEITNLRKIIESKLQQTNINKYKTR